MVKTGDKEKDYLLVLLNCALKNEKAPAPDGVDMNKLLDLASVQQVYNTVLPCLEEIGALTDEQHQKWKSCYLSELQKTIFVNNEREQICSEFDRQGIKYIFLKGLVIRDLYPKSLMRQMSDNDILIDASKRDDAEKIMLAQGFYLSSGADQSDDYFKQPYCTIELHRELFNHIFMQEIYTSEMIWSRAKKADDNSERYIMSDIDNYAYTLFHMFKHYIINGCGVRFLCDMYLLSKNTKNLDFEYIDKLISKIDENPSYALIEGLPKFFLSKFKDNVIGLVDAIFCDKEINDEEMQLLNDLLNGSVYGKGISLEENIKLHGGKFKYLMSKAFPPKEFMLDSYEVLRRKPYLLPIYYIKHLLHRIKHKKDKMKKELKAVTKA